jgi:large subunit ribosomal protein L29
VKASELRDLRDKSVDELRQQISQNRKDLYELRSKRAVGQVPKAHLEGKYKKDIARCLTLITEKEQGGGAGDK